MRCRTGTAGHVGRVSGDAEGRPAKHGTALVMSGRTAFAGPRAYGYARPSWASKRPSSRRCLIVVRKRAASAPSMRRWS